MSQNVKSHFSKTVMDYDTVVDAVVMRNSQLHAYLAASLELSFEKPLELLDLGVGTGHGASLVLKKYEQAFLTGVDFSARMLEKAETNLSPFLDRVRLIEEDITSYTPDKRFDGVISAVTIHNLSHEKKKDLFEKLAQWLKPGAMFVNADFCRRESEEADKRAQDTYLDYVKSKLSGEELDAWIRHIQNADNPEKLSDQFALLESYGFENPQITWQYENEAVYRATKG